MSAAERPAVRLGAFAAGLVLAFAAAFAVGSAAPPLTGTTGTVTPERDRPGSPVPQRDHA